MIEKATELNQADNNIIRLVKTVNSYWTAPDLKVASKPGDYTDVLFNDVEVNTFQTDYAMNVRTLYRQQLTLPPTNQRLCRGILTSQTLN